MRKKQKRNVALAVIAGVIIAAVIGYNYYIDQIKVKGLVFGNELKQIQDDLKALSEDFDNHKVMWEEGEISKDEFVDFLKNNQRQMEQLIERYNELDIPKPFISSVEFFRMSTESQIESIKEYLLWVETGDSSHKVRSEELFQEAFDFEMTALYDFNAAKSGNKP